MGIHHPDCRDLQLLRTKKKSPEVVRTLSQVESAGGVLQERLALRARVKVFSDSEAEAFLRGIEELEYKRCGCKGKFRAMVPHPGYPDRGKGNVGKFGEDFERLVQCCVARFTGESVARGEVGGSGDDTGRDESIKDARPDVPADSLAADDDDSTESCSSDDDSSTAGGDSTVGSVNSTADGTGRSTVGGGKSAADGTGGGDVGKKRAPRTAEVDDGGKVWDVCLIMGEGCPRMPVDIIYLERGVRIFLH